MLQGESCQDLQKPFIILRFALAKLIEYIYVTITQDGFLKLQQSAQLEEQYNNDGLKKKCITLWIRVIVHIYPKIIFLQIKYTYTAHQY